MQEAPTYAELEAAYQAAVAGGNEPNLLPIRVIKNPVKSERRRIGRWLRRGLIQRGDFVPVFSHGLGGAYRV